ncbi:small subunit of acetolactate synthase-domain-containing protein [Mycena leptocephala]|nr:small subunit of acetolactate synthase-domain-containing protein [Mycena leptocephala]
MLSLRARAAARPLYSRFLASTTRLRADGDAPRPPQPPKPIDDSTSALDYKQSQRTRPPPLPTMDLPRSRSAEEAVTNILYNTPPPSLQPFKKHVLNCLVQNEPGVLSRVSGILAGRGFNMIPWFGQDGVVEQARRQLEDLFPTQSLHSGPEYLEEQLQGGPSHEPRRTSATSKLEREAALVHNIERSAHSEEHAESSQTPLTPSEALRLKHQHLHSINVLASQFGAKIVDVSENSVIVELTAKTARVEAFLNLVKPFGILEAARTGLMECREHLSRLLQTTEPEATESVAVDAHLLPPG